MSPRYAEGTDVPVDKSVNQIRALLLGAGASHYAFGEGPEGAAVQFALNGLHYRFDVRRPTWEQIVERYGAPGRVDRKRAVDNEWRRRWRARHLWVKAQVEFAEVEPEAFAQAMLAHLVLPDGRQFGAWAEPQVQAMYSSGTMPPLLTEGRVSRWIPIGRGAGHLTALEQNREDAALGAAWRRCEAALPEGCTFSVGKTAGVRSGPYVAITDYGPIPDGYRYGPTPTSALGALAEKLESLRP